MWELTKELKKITWGGFAKLTASAIRDLKIFFRSSALFFLDNKLFEAITPAHIPFTRLEVELSTVCVSKCFACPRTKNRPSDKGWNVGHLKAELFFEFLSSSPQLNRIIFCGAYGDPIYHPNFIEIIDRLNTEHPHITVTAETNGSHRKVEWWKRLGEVSTHRNTYCFSLDGLADTNEIYRRGTDWNSIEEGIKTLRENHPGEMHWKWILFSHNQHQISEGYKKSVALGFNNFKMINSVRHNDVSRPTMDFAQACNLVSKEKDSTEVL